MCMFSRRLKEAVPAKACPLAGSEGIQENFSTPAVEKITSDYRAHYQGKPNLHPFPKAKRSGDGTALPYDMSIYSGGVAPDPRLVKIKVRAVSSSYDYEPYDSSSTAGRRRSPHDSFFGTSVGLSIGTTIFPWVPTPHPTRPPHPAPTPCPTPEPPDCLTCGTNPEGFKMNVTEYVLCCKNFTGMGCVTTPSLCPEQSIVRSLRFGLETAFRRIEHALNSEFDEDDVEEEPPR
eukprot:gene137-455_t